MKLVALAAFIAVCGAAKLDRTYLPPASAATAGGSTDLQAPLTRTSEQGDSSGTLPTGSYTNNFQGVVVDAAGAGTRASPEIDQSGLGGPRDTYGSQNSKVGEAAFRGSLTGFSSPFNSGFNGQHPEINAGQNFGAFESKSERPQASKDRNSNIISYANDVSIDNYSYGFESDNGIAVGENGVANNGIQAQGGYSYKGDDGQVYKVTYVADEGGYRPQGDHLPTPPPIPKEILESLEKNAKDEAAGLIDDGSYDAQKYNAEGDYTHHNGGNIQYNGAQLSQFAKRPESDATASNTFISQNTQVFEKPGQLNSFGVQNTQSSSTIPSNQFGSSFSNENSLTGSQNQEKQTLSGQQVSSFSGVQNSGQYSQQQPNMPTEAGKTQSLFGNQISQFASQNDQLKPVSQFSNQQSSQFSSQSSQQEQSQPLGHFNQFGSQVHRQPGSVFQINGQANKESAPLFGTQFNKPSFGSNIVQSEPNKYGNQGLKPQSTFGAGEYLPPFKANEKPSYKKPQTNGVSSPQIPNNESPDFVALQGQNSDATLGSNSAASAGYQSQASQTLNSFQMNPSGQNNFNYNNELSQTNSLPSTFSNSGANTLSGSASVKPTSIPSIELTTPLEPNETPNQTQNLQFNSQSQSIAQSLNTQEQPQNSVQNINIQQSISHTFSPSVTDSRPQGTTQFGSTSPSPVAFSTTQNPNINENKPQYTQNTVAQSQQNNYYSTQTPSFSQGSDDSYYYNQPSKPFGTPVASGSQGSRFPSSTSYQPYGVAPTQNNQFPNQQVSQSTFNNINNSPSISPVAPTPSQFVQNEGNIPTNGITQASISPFPSVSPTSSTQYGPTQSDRFGPNYNVPSFPSRPISTFGQSQSSVPQSQTIFGQTSPNNNKKPPTSQSLASNPTNSFEQTSTTSFSSQTQFSINKEKPQNTEIISQQDTSIPSQQYNGTVYEYNKPPEVLPASDESDSSSSQTVQTDSSSKPAEKTETVQESKPQFGSQDTQFNQNTFSSQTQQPSLNQGIKPQFGSQTYKPFGASQSSPTQFGLNTQSTFVQQNNQGSENIAKPNNPNGSAFVTTPQFTQNQQFTSQTAKPFTSSVSSSAQYGQQTTQFGAKPFKPFGGTQTQAGQYNFGGINQQNAGSQSFVQPNKPFGSVPSQLGQAAQNQNLQVNRQPLNENVQSNKPFGSQDFQGYPSTKPQYQNQLTLPQFTQSSQQTFGSPQANSQTNNVPKPIGQNSQSNSQFAQQSYQTTQFGSVSKPQIVAQPQFGQNSNNGFGSASSQAQLGHNSVQALSSAVSPSLGVQAYKPFGSSTNIQSQNKPQFDQAPQTSAVSSTIAPLQIGGSPSETSIQGSQNQSQGTNAVPCCKSTNTGSAIAPLNVGKPSQAFAQTQSQFTGFQGIQGFGAQSFAGKGEEFGGPRQPPSFDAQTGYHY